MRLRIVLELYEMLWKNWNFIRAKFIFAPVVLRIQGQISRYPCGLELAPMLFSKSLFHYFLFRTDLTPRSHRWQWRIQLWADRAAAPPPNWPKLRAGHGGAKQSASNTGANFHLNLYNFFGHFLYETWQNLSASGGFCPTDPLPGALPHGPRETPV